MTEGHNRTTRRYTPGESDIPVPDRNPRRNLRTFRGSNSTATTPPRLVEELNLSKT